MLSIINQALLLKLNKVVNNLIQEEISLKPKLLQKLQKLDAKSVQIKLNGLPVDLIYIIKFNNAHIVINSINNNKIADLNINLMPGSLIRAKVIGVEQSIRNRDIEFTGDLHLAMELQSIFNSIEFNFKDRLQQKIADITSDSFAWQFINILDKIFERIDLKNKELTEQITDYVQLEQGLLVNKFVMEDFISEVDRIRDDVERLAVRIEKLYY